MKTRDVVILVVVLLGIGWLLFDNYKRGQITIEHPKAAAPAAAPAK